MQHNPSAPYDSLAHICCHLKVDDIALSVHIEFAKDGLTGTGNLQQFFSQFWSICRCNSQCDRKYMCLVLASWTIQVQAIITQLSDVNDSTSTIW